MRILYLAGRELSYPRNDVLVRALRRIAEVDLVGGVHRGSIISRSLRALLKTPSLLKRQEYDLCVVGFYGHLIMLLLPTRDLPIIFDPFVSTFDTLVNDRQLFSSNSPLGRLARWLDIKACRSANVLLYDTAAHREYFQETFDLADRPNSVIPVSCNSDLFQPRIDIPTEEDTLLFYSTFLPLHGVEVILHAIALLPKELNIQLKLLGDGPGKIASMRLVGELNLSNVEFLDTIPIETLPEVIASSAVCLGGHFGRSDKADRVIPGKIYQLLAMGKPIIAADTTANRELLTHRETAYLCKRNDPEDLAESIVDVFADSELRESLSLGARMSYLRQASEQVVFLKLKDLFQRIMSSGPQHSPDN